MKSAIALISFLGLTLIAEGATTVQSEFFYQANPSQNVVTPEYIHNDTSFKQTGGSKYTGSSQIINFAYERGINESFSVGATLGYVTGDAKISSSTSGTSGLTELALIGKGQAAVVDGSSLHYGLTLFYSPTDREFDVDINKSDSNGVSGGHSLQPFIGYQWLLNSNVLGLKAQTDVLLGDRKIKITGASTGEQERSGGEVTKLTLFYEIPHAAGAVGFTYSYVTAAEVTGKSSSGSFKMDNDYTANQIGLYSPYKLSEQAQIIGRVVYTTYSDYGPTGIDSSSIVDVSVAGRFAF
ncbi:MAG: hypothetical protein IT288_17930 [Bdellovibrionales bacterium]|nr:hypothetical protein [Bdellovibrionales bacterium]